MTGVVDAACFLGLGRVFTGNMTGNVLLLGFATAGAPGISFERTLVAFVSFVGGAVVGGLVVGRRSDRSGLAFLVEWVLLTGALVLAATSPVRGDALRVVVPLGLAMGMQSTVVRRLMVPDANTLVLTTALGGLLSDALLVGGPPIHGGRRLATIVLLFVGAVGGALLERRSVTWALLGALVVATAGIATLARSGILRHGHRGPVRAPGG